MIRVAYIGASDFNSTSRHRAEALKRIGCTVFLLDPYKELENILKGWASSPLHFHTGYKFIQKHVEIWCREALTRIPAIDVIWIDSGELFGPACLEILKSRESPVILFNHDDPTGPRDGKRFASLRDAIPFYDLCSVCRKESKNEFTERGAKAVFLFTRGYDEVAHAPFENESEIPADMRSEVAFVGTWIRGEGRDKFLMDLISAGVPISIWGNRWQKSPFWPQLTRHYRGSGLSGRKYVAALQGAKVCLGFLSKGNRDLSTSRSTEIPFAGGLLCAERTSEHQLMYQEGSEAVFWSDSKECASMCLQLLGDTELRNNIRCNSRRRVLQLKVGNEDICRSILDQLYLSQ